ncbi:MAG: hypothetical protein WCO84_04440 [bacterium]
MNNKYRGTIIEESLSDNRVLNNVEITSLKISEEENPQDRWHLYTVSVSREDIEKLSCFIKAGKWYMHFWKDREIIAVFKDKVFDFNYDNKDSWKNAVDHGLSLGIPREQLDFIIE